MGRVAVLSEMFMFAAVSCLRFRCLFFFCYYYWRRAVVITVVVAVFVVLLYRFNGARY